MKLITALLALVFVIGCGGGGGSGEQVDANVQPLLNVEAPPALVAPEYITPASEEDWKAKVNNKDIEIIGVINIINPVAAYITEGFKQYGTRFSAQLQEEWEDTQHQLGAATKLYDSCNERREKGQFDKKLFLDMEETWQLLVKTGVAGVRTKSMVDSEIISLTR